MLRFGVIEFLIQSAQLLEVSPIVKYSALSLFVERFYPALSRFEDDKGTKNWLLHPIRESNLQLFALVSIWLSSKIHDMTPLSVEVLKSFGDDFIKEQHYTKRDLLDAEMILMQVLKFEIGTSHIAFIMVDELLSQLKVIARVGEHVNFEVCMDVLDLLYEKEATSLLYNSPCFLAASILVVAYVISVPAQKWEFPILPWVKFVTSYKEEEIMCCVRDILKHIFEPQADYGDPKLN
ncbi:cyclin-J18 isoform X2 [Primulina huaijiensis]|uniref:cyclin-J18 isoform X2 n=1 Tax=Primulina huaijiensis TaxID=1492673 RepID=UPI003CC6F652